MAQVTVSKWGKSLAIRLPGEIVKAVGLSDGERVEVETKGGNIFIRRAIPTFLARRDVSRSERQGVACDLC